MLRDVSRTTLVILLFSFLYAPLAMALNTYFAMCNPITISMEIDLRFVRFVPQEIWLLIKYIILKATMY